MERPRAPWTLEPAAAERCAVRALELALALALAR
jgi:hypothetical protein